MLSVAHGRLTGGSLLALFALAVGFACGGSARQADGVDASAGAEASPEASSRAPDAMMGSGGAIARPLAVPSFDCGPGRACAAGQACCFAGGGAVLDPSQCPCPGLLRSAVIGTRCAKSCPGTPRVCTFNQVGIYECPMGQGCDGLDSVQGVTLSVCSATGGSSASSSSGVGPTGSCEPPTQPCTGAVLGCAGTSTCAPGEVCCEILGDVCSDGCSDNGSFIGTSSGPAGDSGSQDASGD